MTRELNIRSTWPILIFAALLLGGTGAANAVETHVGTIRIPTEVKCLSDCDNYILEPDTGSVTYFLRGTDLVLYVGRHVQIYGYRTYCGGCLVISITTVTRLPLTDVQLVDDRKPAGTQLLQNYPNPFNPTTTIRFEIAQAALVTLKVYDVLGTEIATLINAPQSPGTYELSWNSSEVPSGVYYYRLRAGEHTFTKKMIVVK